MFFNYSSMFFSNLHFDTQNFLNFQGMITGDWFPEKLPAPFTRSIYPYPLHLPATRYPLQLDTPGHNFRSKVIC